VPRLCELYPGICLTTEKKAWKNLSQGSQKIRIDKPNNKNTSITVFNSCFGSKTTNDVKYTREIKSRNTTGKEAFKNKEVLFTDTWRRTCLLKHIIEGKIEGGIEMTGRRG
jgi:hypothetical protein